MGDSVKGRCSVDGYGPRGGKRCSQYRRQKRDRGQTYWGFGPKKEKGSSERERGLSALSVSSVAQEIALHFHFLLFGP